MGNLPDSVRSRKDPVAPVEAGHRSNTVCLIHHLSMKLGRRLYWDPENEKFVKRELIDRRMQVVGDDDEANFLLGCSHREPYEI